MVKKVQLTRAIATFALLSFGCSASLFAGDLRVTKFQQLIAQGNRPAWGSNNVIAFDAPGSAVYFDVYTMNPDGSNVTCLTCSATSLPSGSKGNPDWRPQADFLAIQVQTVAFTVGTASYTASFPGGGYGSDLFITDAAGKSYYQITQSSPDPANHMIGGVLHPRFSHDGTKLIWVQAVPGTSGAYWNLMMGDFSVTGGVPAVTNIQSLPPCASNTVFCETGDFSLDDSTIFFTGALDQQPLTGIDIYSYNISTQTTTNLTNSPSEWDELPRVLPNQNALTWIHGTGSADYRDLMTDFWMMDYDGSNQLQLTYYNDASATVNNWNSVIGSSGGVASAELAWSPDGTQAIAQLTQVGVAAATGGALYLIQTEVAAPTLSGASYARPPLAQDSIITTFYTNLASGSMNASGTTLPTSLDGTVGTLIDAQGNSQDVAFFFVSPGQVNWLMPSGVATGPATFQVTNPQGVSVRATVNVTAVGPGLFTASGTGTGAAVGTLLTYQAGSITPTVQSLYNSSGGLNAVALGGSGTSNFLVLFGTGMRHYGKVVTVQLDGQTLPVAFTGAQGVFFGLDQVNVLVPNSLAGSGTQNLTVTVDGEVSNTVQVQFQ